MTNLRRFSILVVLTLVVSAGLALQALPAKANGCTVEINSGTPVYVNENETRSEIPISIKNIPNLGAGNGIGAFTFKLTWNTYVMRIDSIKPANPSGMQVVTPDTPDNARGQATIAGFTGANYLVGNATVALITLTGLTSTQGAGAILVEIISLGDKGGVMVPATPVNGRVEVTRAGSAPPGGTPAPPPPATVTYTLTIAANGTGTISPAPGSYTHPAGAVVSISATPPAGGQFTGWTGEVANPTVQSTQVTMDKSKAITANFAGAATSFSLTLLTSGQGTITPPAGSYSQTAGTVVELKATPAAGWKFSNWSGEVTNPAAATTTITINGNKTITAIFIQEGATPTPAPAPAPGATPKPGTPAPVTNVPTPTAAAQPPASSGLAGWQIALIVVGCIAVLAPVLYFILKRLVIMRTYRV
jgi:hypothetical protein